MTGRVARDQVLGGKFRLARPLASDPMLGVWLADDLQLQREVVIKILHPEWMENETLVERFRFEALAAARVDHENVARTYDVEHSDGVLFTVTEYVAGPTVDQLNEHAPLDPVSVAALGQQTALGLAAAHAEGILHGAICPENLVISTSGRLCIIDFGAVRPLEGGAQPDPVFPEPALETYWPPERRAREPVHEQGDVYSLGLVLWEAWTGSPAERQPPARGAGRRLLDSVRGGDSATALLADALGAATAEEPEQRPTASGLADRLAEVCGMRPQEPLGELIAQLDTSS